jgi:hypothetical protein
MQASESTIVVAIIGLVGVLATALFSNWDKLFGNVVQARATRTPTDNFETELRYYFEVSGTRAATESMQQQMIQNQKLDLLSMYPQDAEMINREFDAIAREAIRFEDVIKALLPVYQKHFTLGEIQELNKFYSTDVMRGMVTKMPLITQEAAPIQVRLLSDYFQRLGERLDPEPRQNTA